MSEHAKQLVDAVSLTTVIATVASWLPPIAALLSIIWTVLRIIEMVTGKTIADLLKGFRQWLKRK